MPISPWSDQIPPLATSTAPLLMETFHFLWISAEATLEFVALQLSYLLPRVPPSPEPPYLPDVRTLPPCNIERCMPAKNPAVVTKYMTRLLHHQIERRRASALQGREVKILRLELGGCFCSLYELAARKREELRSACSNVPSKP